jgi:hypothetical protein
VPPAAKSDNTASAGRLAQANVGIWAEDRAMAEGAEPHTVTGEPVTAELESVGR